MPRSSLGRADVSDHDTLRSTWFQRFILPGFAFKAVVIGGGYSTGRELAEFFIPSAPWGGLAGMILAMLIWSAVCMTTFLFARATRSLDYRQFFQHLLGPFAILFELSYFPYIVIVLAVFGAASAGLGTALFGWPPLAGTLCLIAGIVLFTTFGNASVERLFKWVSIFLYGTYFVFLVLAALSFGSRIAPSFATPVFADGWAFRGVTYAGYNIIGAVVVLPIVRHMRSDADAIKAGLLAGPLAMLPAMVFFICMCAFYPQIGDAALPSQFMLQEMHRPTFAVVFQLMIFAALLESGTGSVHAVNERIASAYHRMRSKPLPNTARLGGASIILVTSIFLAQRFGIVTLIARGYRGLSYAMLLIYVIPLMTYGLWWLWRRKDRPDSTPLVSGEAR
jgi:uncharacterized membrane protein YkvI